MLLCDYSVLDHKRGQNAECNLLHGHGVTWVLFLLFDLFGIKSFMRDLMIAEHNTTLQMW